ncbi:MFS family permease [Pseudomonas citronellolis]|uniref:MFS transporter n=1 Tax=Pseudomonas citronellolis TaxID=53408 RepID=UPI000E2EDBB2|nr:MFS transporter [Pseudomonas citronellolis]MCP1645974.1 MFS family permease [Pseudomonas citronellolis]MCP1668956.1 MFS family permease [Pseudomonas citronellolis]MCP1700320.1 MFS family permease [Pseudomonas citronellolis]MCP1706632.1 MFS family permease [Pseudomonas citronellolis]MCP1800549.1 MFS family permease [Pseudomonas citronellolis]
MHNNDNKWNARYEYTAVAMLALGFGLVGLDRFIILPLFPVMMAELHLDYQDLGNISAILAIAWGISSIFMGRLSDRIGRRKVLIPAVLLFSLLAGLSGLANGVAALLLIRAVMGVSEGAFTPTAIAATAESSHPSRRGLNIGIQQAFFPILGLGLAPILATQLLLVLPSWRWVFVVVSLPGFLLAWFMYRNLRETRVPAAADVPQEQGRWLDALRYRNVPLNILGMFCMLTSLFVLSVMMPNYLTDYLHLELQQMGFVMSAIGLGGFIGQLVLPGLSDRLGRKPVVLGSFVATGACIWLLMHTGAEPLTLFALLFLTTFFNFSMICMTVGPLTGESVPLPLVSTATGLVVGIGEVFGGGVAPALAGYIAQHHGIQYTLYLALGGVVLGLAAASLLRETAPLRRKAPVGQAGDVA